LTPPNWDYHSSETALSQSPKMYQESELMRQQLSSCAIYNAYTLDLRRHSPIRIPQQLQPETQPGPIGFLEPQEVLVLDNEEGTTKVTWADSEKFDLDLWLKDYSLVELWQMGRIGGRV
jgi:hypothetical protein